MRKNEDYYETIVLDVDVTVSVFVSVTTVCFGYG